MFKTQVESGAAGEWFHCQAFSIFEQVLNIFVLVTNEDTSSFPRTNHAASTIPQQN